MEQQELNCWWSVYLGGLSQQQQQQQRRMATTRYISVLTFFYYWIQSRPWHMLSLGPLVNGISITAAGEGILAGLQVDVHFDTLKRRSPADL